MLKLCGFAASNYYNKVKLALLEKGCRVRGGDRFPSRDEELLGAVADGQGALSCSTGHGALSESQAIVEYIEEVFPARRCIRRIRWRARKCRELIHLIELYLELAGAPSVSAGLLWRRR